MPKGKSTRVSILGGELGVSASFAKTSARCGAGELHGWCGQEEEVHSKGRPWSEERERGWKRREATKSCCEDRGTVVLL